MLSSLIQLYPLFLLLQFQRIYIDFGHDILHHGHFIFKFALLFWRQPDIGLLEVLEDSTDILNACSEQSKRSDDEEIPVWGSQSLGLRSSDSQIVHVAEGIIGENEHDDGTYDTDDDHQNFFDFIRQQLENRSHADMSRFSGSEAGTGECNENDEELGNLFGEVD